MDYKEILPEAPEGMAEWLHGLHARGREVLIYGKTKLRNPLTEQKEPYAACECSYCGQKWYAEIRDNGGGHPLVETLEGFKGNGESTTCPECGESLELAIIRRLKRYPIKSMIYPWTITKAKGCVVFSCWGVMHKVDEFGSSVEVAKRNAYIVTPAGKWVRYTAMERGGWCACSPMVYTEQWRQVEKFSFADGSTRLIFPHPADVYEGTALENGKLEVVERDKISCDLTAYAKLYLKRPKIENLVMTCPKIAAWALKRYTGTGGKLAATDWINWDASRPHEMLGMGKAEMRRVEGMEESDTQPCREIALRKQRTICVCKKLGISMDLAEAVEKIGVEFVSGKLARSWVARSFGAAEPVRFIARQHRLAKKGKRMEETIKDCTDYWADFKRVQGADRESYTAVFPTRLEIAHARIIAAKKYAEDKELVDKFNLRSKQLAGLAWEHNGLLIRVAHNESELIAEGKILDHCVGGYGDEHCAGNSIFFIRRAEAPEVPYFTLQLDTKKGRVLQNRGKKNCARTKEVQEFETEWMSTVVQPWIEKKTKNTSAGYKKNGAA